MLGKRARALELRDSTSRCGHLATATSPIEDHHAYRQLREHRSVGGVESGTVVPIPSSEEDRAAIGRCEQAIAVTLDLMHPARALRRRLSRLGKLRTD